MADVNISILRTTQFFTGFSSIADPLVRFKDYIEGIYGPMAPSW